MATEDEVWEALKIRIEECKTKAELKAWVAERRAGIQTSNGRFSVESIEWRDYHSKWHKEYWDLVYKKGRIIDQYRERINSQASMLMEKDWCIKQYRLFLEQEGLKHKYDEYQKTKAEQAQQMLGLRASKYLRETNE